MLAARPEQVRPAAKRLLVVDDHPILRRGLTALIESEPDLSVHAAVGTRAAALASMRESPPDLAIVDLSLGDEDGLDFIKEMKLRYPKVPSLVLSVHDEAIYAERALSAGALGYVSKQQLDDTVLAAIRGVLAGETYMSEALRRRLAEQYVHGQTLETASPVHRLSDRELQVSADRSGPDHASDRRDAEPERQDDRVPPRAHQEQAGHPIRRRTGPARDPVGRNRPHRLIPSALGSAWGFTLIRNPNTKYPPTP
jgi:DNA-binding NarL/FixJ family response regulator